MMCSEPELVLLRTLVINNNEEVDKIPYEKLISLQSHLCTYGKSLITEKKFVQAKAVFDAERIVSEQIKEQAKMVHDYQNAHSFSDLVRDAPTTTNISQTKAITKYDQETFTQEQQMKSRHSQVLRQFEDSWSNNMRLIYTDDKSFNDNYQNAKTKLKKKLKLELNALAFSRSKQRNLMKSSKTNPPKVVHPTPTRSISSCIRSELTKIAYASRKQSKNVSTINTSKQRSRAPTRVETATQSRLETPRGDETSNMDIKRVRFISTAVFVSSSPRNL